MSKTIPPLANPIRKFNHFTIGPMELVEEIPATPGMPVSAACPKGKSPTGPLLRAVPLAGADKGKIVVVSRELTDLDDTVDRTNDNTPPQAEKALVAKDW